MASGTGVFVGLLLCYQQQPKSSPPFSSRLEAKAWCKQNSHWEDDVYGIHQDGSGIIERGMIDNMYENDEEYHASIS